MQVIIIIPELNSVKIFNDVYSIRSDYENYRDSIDTLTEDFYSLWGDGDCFKNGMRIEYENLPHNVKATYALLAK